MAPNKFEKHIKKQLENREIRPSAKAWEKVSERLEPTQGTKSQKFLWYAVAASFIGILIVSVVYFNSGDPANTPDVQLVDTNDEAIQSKTILNGKAENRTEEIVVQNDKIGHLPATPVETVDANRIPDLLDQVTSADEIDTTIEKAVVPNDLKEEMISTKILEIVATVDSLEQNNVALTDAEVDNLLRNAQEEILRDKLFDQNGSVNAMALLTEVEDELEKSFRDQIFDSLKTGFLKVRTAVADRNN